MNRVQVDFAEYAVDLATSGVMQRVLEILVLARNAINFNFNEFLFMNLLRWGLCGS
jgi:hypothetical protein